MEIMDRCALSLPEQVLKNKQDIEELKHEPSHTIDTELSTTSVNAVQNKVITTKINEMDEQIATNEENITKCAQLTGDNGFNGNQVIENDGTVVLIDVNGIEVIDSNTSVSVSSDEVQIKNVSSQISTFGFNQSEFVSDEYNKTINLFINQATDTYINGLTFTYNSINSVRISGTATNNVTYRMISPNNPYQLESNTNYTFSTGDRIPYSSEIRIQDSVDSRIYKVLRYNENYITFNSSFFTSGKVHCFLYLRSGETYDFNLNFQLEKGSIATSYKEYNGSIIHQKQLDDATKGVLLWSGSSTESITFTYTPSDYSYIRIIFKNGYDYNSSLIIPSVIGTKFNLSVDFIDTYVDRISNANCELVNEGINVTATSFLIINNGGYPSRSTTAGIHILKVYGIK